MATRAEGVRIDAGEDHRLLDRVLSGDAGAWHTFCGRYEGLIVGCVLRVLRRYGACFTTSDLADLAGEVWVMLLRDDRKKLRQYNPAKGYKLSSWIGLIATNCTIDHLRARASDLSYLEDLSGADRWLVAPASPHTELEHREAVALADRAISRLTADERSFLVACFHEDRPPLELADELGISVNTVYSRKFKLREKLVRIAAELSTPPAEQPGSQPTA